MQKLLLVNFFFLLIISSSFAQKSTNVKKGTLYVNDTAICLFDKMKKKLNDPPNFDIKSLDEKPLGGLKYGMTILPNSGQQKWFQLTMEGQPDTVSFTYDEYLSFHKGSNIIIPFDEILGKVVGKYALVLNGAPNPEGLKNLKAQFPDNTPLILAEKQAKENWCMKHTNEAVKSKANTPVTVELTSTKEISKYRTELIYTFKQDGNIIGTLTAKGSAKGAKSEDAEYEYSPGIIDADGASPLQYEINNTDGCQVAFYYAEDRFLFIRKDYSKILLGDIKKYNKGNIASRISFIQAFANLLVAKRYL